MKKLISAAIMFLPFAAIAQDAAFTVQGKVGSYNAPAKMYLRYLVKGKMVTDSVTLKNGNFKFNGMVPVAEPSQAVVALNTQGTGLAYKDSKYIYLEKGTISVNSADSVSKATVEGTQTNVENEKYQTAMKPAIAAEDAIETKLRAVTDEQRKSETDMRALYKVERDAENQDVAAEKKFIQENPDSYVSLGALEMVSYYTDYNDVAPLYNSLSDRVKQTPAGKSFAERLPKLKAVAIGAVAPEFTEADTAGKMVSLSSFRGKYILVDFWASWCGPCRRENPNVVRTYNTFKNKNFTVLGVSLDNPKGKDKWLTAIHKDGLIWTQVSDLQSWKSKEAELYGVRAIPQNFLIDPNGKIIAHNLMGFDLLDKLTEILGKGDSAPSGSK